MRVELFQWHSILSGSDGATLRVRFWRPNCLRECRPGAGGRGGPRTRLQEEPQQELPLGEERPGKLELRGKWEEGEAEEAVRAGAQEGGAEGGEAEEHLRTPRIADLFRATGMSKMTLACSVQHEF